MKRKKFHRRSRKWPALKDEEGKPLLRAAGVVELAQQLCRDGEVLVPISRVSLLAWSKGERGKRRDTFPIERNQLRRLGTTGFLYTPEQARRIIEWYNARQIGSEVCLPARARQTNSVQSSSDAPVPNPHTVSEP